MSWTLRAASQEQAETAATPVREEADTATPPAPPELVVELDEATPGTSAGAPAPGASTAARSRAASPKGPVNAGLLETIKLDRIRTADQPRQTFANIPELAETIRAVGLLESLKVRPSGDGYELVEGERRLRALRLNAEKHGGPDSARCEIRILSDQEADELRLVANLQREGFTPLEEAAGYATMRDRHGLSVEEIGQRFGVGKNTVYKRLKLLDLGPEARKALEAGEINASVAVLVAQRPSHKVQAQAVVRLKERGITSHEAAAELLLQEFGYELRRAPFDREDPLLTSASECSKCPHNTRNQRQLDGKSSADVCTNSPCYAEKVEAHVAKEKGKATEAGKRWLPAAEAKAAFHGADEIPATSDYVDLEAVCYEDNRKRRTWRQLLPAEAMPPLCAARNPRGEVRTLVLKADAVAAARAAGTLGEKQAEVAGRDKKAERAAVEEEGELLAAVAEKVLRAGVEEAKKGFSPLLMRALLAPMLEACPFREALETRRGRSVEHLQKELSKTGEAELRGLLFEVCFAEHAEDLGPAALAMAKALGLDRKKLVKEAQAERQKVLDMEAAEELVGGRKAGKKNKAKTGKKAP